MDNRQDRYRLFFESSTDAMLTLQDGRFVDCNGATLKMLGLESREELEKTHPADISPLLQPDGCRSFEKAEEMIALALKNGSNRFDWVHKSKDGKTFPVEVLLIADPRDKERYVNVVWRDIADRFVLEKALLDAKLLGEAVTQSGVSTLITDSEGCIEYVNPAFCKINGYSLEEVLGRTPGILNSGIQSKEFYDDMWGTISQGDIWHGTLQNIRKSGERYWASLKISPVKDESGKIIKYVGIETDISDFIEAKEKAEKANLAKSEFLSSMSHELRTPLNSILGFAQLIGLGKENPLTQRQLMQLGHIQKAGEHLLHLIDEILDLSKVEAGKMTYQIEDIRFSDILPDCMSYIKTAHTQLNVSVHDMTSGDLPRIKADPLRLRQVVLNLLSNAKKYNRENGEVMIECETTGDARYLRLIVKDTGYGIAQDEQAHLFEPFNRLGAERSDIEGSGIGLVLTKKIVEEMGGKIGFESTVDVGSAFWVEFPIAQEDMLHQVNIQIEADDLVLHCCNRKHTLLYIEDNAMNRDVVDGLVTEIPNLELISADTAQKGIEIAKIHKPHLILMDINLPDMDGFEAFKKLRADRKTADIPVVALSASAMGDAVERAQNMGFRDYLTKPFRMSDMMRVLNENIEN